MIQSPEWLQKARKFYSVSLVALILIALVLAFTKLYALLICTFLVGLLAFNGHRKAGVQLKEYAERKVYRYGSPKSKKGLE